MANDDKPKRVSRAPTPPPRVSHFAGIQNPTDFSPSPGTGSVEFASPGPGEPGYSQDIGRDIALAQEQSERSSEKPTVANPAPKTASPMPYRDRRFWVILGIWAAIAVGAFGTGIGAFISGSPHWGFFLSAAGLIGAAVATFHLLETKPSPPVRSRVNVLMACVAAITWVFIGWQTYMWFHATVQGYTQAQLDDAVAKARAVPVPPPAPSPQSKQVDKTAQQQSANKIIIDTTPDFLMNLYVGKMQSEGDRLTAPFIGKWIKITETVADVSKGSVFAFIKDPDGAFRTINMAFDPSEADNLDILSRDQKITVLCQIFDASDTHIRLNHCNFLDK